MHRRSTLRAFVAVLVTALLVAIGGTAYAADNIIVSGDVVEVGGQQTIGFGEVACGATATRNLEIVIRHNGGGQVYQAGSTVGVAGTASAAALSVSAPSGAISIPSGWNAQGNNGALTDSVTAIVAVTPTGASPAGTSITLTGVETKADGTTGISRQLVIPVSWTVGPCGKIATTTSVTCDPAVEFTGAALTPCTASTSDANGAAQSSPTLSYSGNTNVGTVDVTATFAETATHKASSASTTFQITPAGSVTAVTCPQSVPYDGSAQTPCTAKVTGVGGLDQTLTPSYSPNTDAGTVTVSANYGGDSNHTGSTGGATFLIATADATCEVIGFAGDYDADAHRASGTCTGLDGADLTSGLDVGESFTDVPGGEARWQFSYPNYTSQSGTAQITIGPAATSISITCEAAVYDGTAQEPCTAKVTGPGLSQNLAVTYGNNTNAGVAATASASYAATLNHQASSASTTFTIAKAPSTTVVDCPATVTFTGSALTPCTVSTTGPGGLTAAPQIDYLGNTHAGLASAEATYGGDDNHESSSDSATFVIDPAPSTITITCEPSTVTFTGEAHEPCAATVTGDGGLSQAVTVSYQGNIHAGTAKARAEYGGDPDHYGSSKEVEFVIERAESVVTVTCPTAAIVFTGSAIEPCSAHVKGAGGLDQPVTPVTYVNNIAVGTQAKATAAYPGDDDHLPGAGSAFFEIAAWRLTGFYKPVDMNGIINIVKAGSTVPLKFNAYAGATEITDTAALGARFSVKTVACESGAVTSDDLITTTGNTVLRYDATGRQWVQNWLVPKTGGPCYKVTLITLDGSELSALFRTK